MLSTISKLNLSYQLLYRVTVQFWYWLHPKFPLKYSIFYMYFQSRIQFLSWHITFSNCNRQSPVSLFIPLCWKIYRQDEIILSRHLKDSLFTENTTIIEKVLGLSTVLHPSDGWIRNYWALMQASAGKFHIW